MKPFDTGTWRLSSRLQNRVSAHSPYVPLDGALGPYVLELRPTLPSQLVVHTGLKENRIGQHAVILDCLIFGVQNENVPRRLQLVSHHQKQHQQRSQQPVENKQRSPSLRSATIFRTQNLSLVVFSHSLKSSLCCGLPLPGGFLGAGSRLHPKSVSV